MAGIADNQNRTDEEKNSSLVVPFNPTSPPMRQTGIIFYQTENANPAITHLPAPGSNQSSLTPTAEAFCPGLQVYIPPPEMSNPSQPMMCNPAQPITGVHCQPDTTTHEIQPIISARHDHVQPITSTPHDIQSIGGLYHDIGPITSVHCQPTQTAPNFTPMTMVQCPSVTSVTTETAPPPTQERITELERQLKEAVRELTFLGDRNWRMEAYIDCLVHTLRKMDVTTVIDLNQKMLPLSLFHVKAKAGFQLGSFNQLPRRSVWSYSKDGVPPPIIDLSGTHVVGKQPIRMTGLLKELEANNLIPVEGDDIGLSVEQLFEYDRRVVELERETFNLKERLQTASDKESILMERLRTSQQTANYLEEELNNKCEELNQAQFHIARLEHQNFRRYPKNPHFSGRFRPRHRYPFHRPPFPYPPHPTMPFPPPPPLFAAAPPPPPTFENGTQLPPATYEEEAHTEAPVVSELPPNQPVYFIAPPYPPPQLPPSMIEETTSNEGADAQILEVNSDIPSTTVASFAATSSFVATSS